MQPNIAQPGPKFERLSVYVCTRCDEMLYGFTRMPKKCPECEE